MICKCPICGKINSDDWPVTVAGEVIYGGCQDCWETECDGKWWDCVTNIQEVLR